MHAPGVPICVSSIDTMASATSFLRCFLRCGSQTRRHCEGTRSRGFRATTPRLPCRPCCPRCTSRVTAACVAIACTHTVTLRREWNTATFRMERLVQLGPALPRHRPQRPSRLTSHQVHSRLRWRTCLSSHPFTSFWRGWLLGASRTTRECTHPGGGKQIAPRRHRHRV
jgi:hypothetical protein